MWQINILYVLIYCKSNINKEHLFFYRKGKPNCLLIIELQYVANSIEHWLTWGTCRQKLQISRPGKCFLVASKFPFIQAGRFDMKKYFLSILLKLIVPSILFPKGLLQYLLTCFWIVHFLLLDTEIDIWMDKMHMVHRKGTRLISIKIEFEVTDKHSE